MLRQIHVFYSGRVQGVGFRFTTYDIAKDLKVTGWVRNLYDGKVEVVAEAEEAILKDFLFRLEKYFKRNTQDIDISWQEPTKEFSSFRIEF